MAGSAARKARRAAERAHAKKANGQGVVAEAGKEETRTRTHSGPDMSPGSWARGLHGQATATSPGAASTLPPNATIFYPPDRAACARARGASVFSRLAVVADSQQVLAALGRTPAVTEAFSLVHGNVILVFGDHVETHQEQVRAVLLMLRDNGDLGIDFSECVFDAQSAEAAGFSLDPLGEAALLVVDLGLHADESDSESE